MPPTSAKKLYVAKSLENLENDSELDSSIESKSTAGLIGLADRIFTTAEINYAEKDEEKAFIHYSKFVELMLILKQKPDFQKYPYHIKLSMNVNTAVKRAELFKESLAKRYLDLDEDIIFETGDFKGQVLLQNNTAEILQQNNSESSNDEKLTANGMEGPVVFNSEVRKEVFAFFSKILQTYSEPVYYEYIRGHVSKAPLAVRKYVASKLKGEKFLEYFKLRKNYFTVEGTDVLLKKVTTPKRTRGRSECVTSELSRGRKPSLKRDKSRSKRSQSCSSAVSDSTKASSCVSNINSDEKLEHEDFVNKFFFDLIFRHEKVDIHSLEYDNFPKKVKRHLDLYHKRKVANYFASFPDKYIIDDDWKVSFNLQFPKDTSLAAGPDKTVQQQNGKIVRAKEHSREWELEEIKSALNYTEAILFFMLISTQKKVTIQQLEGYFSQTSTELKSYLKRNYKSVKSFIEEFPSIFLLNSCEEVTVSSLVLKVKATCDDIMKIANKATVGDLSFQSFKEKVDNLKYKIKALSDSHSEKQNKNVSKVVDDALSGSNVAQGSSKKQQKSSTDNSAAKMNKVELGNKNSKVDNESDSDNVPRSVVIQPEVQDLSKIKYNIEHAISCTLSDFEYYGISSENVVFEINGCRYLPTCEPYLGIDYVYEEELKEGEFVNAGKKKVVKIVPTPCGKHKKNFVGGEDTTEMKKKFKSHVIAVHEEKFYRLFIMIDLFCLEMTEADFDFTVGNEIGAIQHFIEILKQPSRKNWTANNLYGTLGKATAEVAAYIRKKYKVDNFISFFKRQPEFEVYDPIVKLSTAYKDTFDRRFKVLTLSLSRNSKWDLLKLFESRTYQKNLQELLTLLSDVCFFLKSRFKAKLTKLEKTIKQFPICLDWIKALEGETIAKKTKMFLELFGIFDFPTGQYISLKETYYNDILMKWFDNSIPVFDSLNSNSDLVSIFHKQGKVATVNPGNETSVLCKEYMDKFCHFLTEDIKNHTPLNYHELPKTIPEDLMKEFIRCGITSRNLIHAILKDGQYFLKKCQINIKTPEDVSDGLTSAENTLYSDNEKEFSKEENLSRSDEKVILGEEGYTKQMKGSDIQVTCADSALGYLNLLNSLNPTCETNSNNSNSVISNQHDIQPPLTNCSSHNTQNESDCLESKSNNLFSDNEKVPSIKETSDISFKVASSEAEPTKSVENSNSEVNNANSASCDNEKVPSEEETSCSSFKVASSEAGSAKQTEDSYGEANYPNSASCEPNSLNSSTQTCITDNMSNNLNALKKYRHILQSILSACESNSLDYSALTCITEPINNLNTLISNHDEFKSIQLAHGLNTLNTSTSNRLTVGTYDDLIGNQHVLKRVLSTFEPNVFNNSTPTWLTDLIDIVINDVNTLTNDSDKLQSFIANCVTQITQSLSGTIDGSPVTDSSEKIKDFSFVISTDHSSNEDKSLTSVMPFQNQKEKLVTLNDESGSFLAKKEKHSIFKIGELAHLYEENSQNAIEKNKAIFEDSCKESHVASPVTISENFTYIDKVNSVSNDSCVEDSFSTLNATKSILLNHDEMGKYLELLKMDDICTEDPTNQNDTCHLEKASYQTIEISTSPITPDHNYSANALELSEEHKVTELVDNTQSKADCSNASTNEKVKKNRKKRKSITKLSGTEDVSEKEFNGNSNSIQDVSVPDNYPLQPISAEIVLLTADSCIAVAQVNSRKQNIYFLKCVFSCDNQNCCSECFDILNVGDIVSCFVPPTEIPKKMWIAFMVSKEDSCHFKEIRCFNETILKQKKDGCMNRNMCVNSKSVSTETECSSVELECNSKPMTDETSQTNISGDIKICAITKDSMCQVKTSVDFASTQTLNEVCSSNCQTETVVTKDKDSQTSHVEFKEVLNCVENSCQTDLTGKVKEIGNLTDTESQTISTGAVMITKYYHL